MITYYKALKKYGFHINIYTLQFMKQCFKNIKDEQGKTHMHTHKYTCTSIYKRITNMKQEKFGGTLWQI